jgi:hypothetical protein
LDASGLTGRGLARHLSVDPRKVPIARRDGLSDTQADTWAIRLGRHPLIVWGWAWIEAAHLPAGPAHVRLAAVLRNQIDRAELAPGDQVPSVAAIAQRWGVGPKTAAHAVAELRAEGLVVGGGRRGRPNVVAPTVPGGPAHCAMCGRSIHLGDEHYPHRPACTLAAHGWCDCDQAAHPECCPSCARGES